MTPRERFIAALERRPIPGRVPHFELVFFLTMEAFGKIHPSQRHYAQWDQMTESERALHRNEMAEIHVQTARKYEHSAIFLHPNPNTEDEALRLIDLVREKSGNDYFLMMHGDPTYSIPSGSDMLEQAAWFYERMDDAMDTADRRVDEQLAACERLKAHGGLDGFALCADYCFNDNPFLRPDLFAVLITPYLKRVVAGMREMGFHVIKHTDGNIMPILDQLVDAGPHALHSLDPQGGVDIAEVKRLYGGKVCLIGNVNCGLLTSGTDEEVIESARTASNTACPEAGISFRPAIARLRDFPSSAMS